MACKFCGAGQGWYDHDSCASECDRRIRAGMCEYCGTMPEGPGGGWCDACNVDRNSLHAATPRYVGYPPKDA